MRRPQAKLGVQADGEFDARTVKALKAWQGKNGLAADGIAGPDTLMVMGLHDLVLLKRGAHGDAVKKLQEQLAIGADGQFGPARRKLYATTRRRMGSSPMAGQGRRRLRISSCSKNSQPIRLPSRQVRLVRSGRSPRPQLLMRQPKRKSSPCRVRPRDQVNSRPRRWIFHSGMSALGVARSAPDEFRQLVQKGPVNPRYATAAAGRCAFHQNSVALPPSVNA